MAGAVPPAYNGMFIVFSVTSTTFQYQMTADPGGDGTGTVRKDRHLFDEIMTAAPAGAIVRLGPGTFHTRGHAEGYGGGWVPKARQRIISA